MSEGPNRWSWCAASCAYYEDVAGLVNVNKKRWKITLSYAWYEHHNPQYIGKSHFSMILMGKSTISMVIFNSFLYVYQRVMCFLLLHDIL